MIHQKRKSCTLLRKGYLLHHCVDVSTKKERGSSTKHGTRCPI